MVNEILIKQILMTAVEATKAAVDAIEEAHAYIGKKEARRILMEVSKAKEADLSNLEKLIEDAIEQRKRDESKNVNHDV